MPTVRYKCANPDCNESFTVFIHRAPDIQSHIACKFCGSLSKRILSAPSSTSKIVIDNGQARAVEVNRNIMELIEDRTKPKNRGD